MALVLGIVLAALFAALFLVRASHGHAAAISRLEELDGRTHPVDLEAFHNLVDPAQSAFLRENLPGHEFRGIQRERALTAAEYVEHIADNAAILLRLGQAARANANPDIAQAAQQMVERALTVRMIAMRALAKLYLQALIPGIRISSADVFERY